MADYQDGTGGNSGKPPKVRRITEKDLQRVSQHLKNELDRRKKEPYRKKAEDIWREVDRQVALDSLLRVARNTDEPTVNDWHSLVELGELSMASELYSADIERITFPMNRAWFEAHSKIKAPLNPQTGEEGKVPKKIQDRVDGALRAMMSQQHIDFGLKARVGLSVKEALHHGSYVATAEWETMQSFYPDGGTSEIKAPVWKVHSMWNCYPDPSPSVIGENMYYQGTMFITSYLPWDKFREIDPKTDGFWGKQLKKVTKQEHELKAEQKTKDVKVETYYGDIFLTRGDGDIFLPNMICKLYNGVLCYAKESPTPWLPVIYRGWERLDVRDPYYMSPVMKMSPWQKLSSVLANKYVDNIELWVEPPLRYDANEPDYVNEGPQIYPGSKFSGHGPNTAEFLRIGDPNAALAGLQMCIGHMKEALSISPQKAGQALGDRATAREVSSVEQGAEVRPMKFIEGLAGSLRSFLYMQHAMNLAEKNFEYEFYNPEMDAPDWMRVVTKDLPKKAHFDVVGARGVLGEAERSQRLGIVVAFAEKVPPMQQSLNHTEILLQMLADAGMKNPERFLMQQGDIPAHVQAQIQGMQQGIQQLQQALKESETGNQVDLQKAVMNFLAKMYKSDKDHKIDVAELALKSEEGHRDRSADIAKHVISVHKTEGIRKSSVAEQPSEDQTQVQQQQQPQQSAIPRRIVIRKTDDGYEGESYPLVH